MPYGESITIEKLRQIEGAEALVTEAGFRINRVRHHGETARVEVEVDALDQLNAQREKLTAAIQGLGFRRVEFDAEGFVSGKLNRVILSSEEK